MRHINGERLLAHHFRNLNHEHSVTTLTHVMNTGPSE
jgi:hypothetical protein